MANYGLNRDEKDRAPHSKLEKSHPTDRFDEGYQLGLQHGIERERERWMNTVGAAISDALKNVTELKETNG